MKDGFIKIACATPQLKVADCGYNTDRILELIRQAHERGVKIVCFPELCITGYTCGDLFLQDALLKSAMDSLDRIRQETEELEIISIIGLPFAYDHKLYNCAAVVYMGRILGLVPKVNLPNYSEFYEARHFTSGGGTPYSITLFGDDDVKFGIDQVFLCDENEDLVFGVEICEDLWVSESPSLRLAQNQCTIIFNLSCSDEIIGKAEYRKMLVKAKSGELVCAYAYADAGIGESTQDMVFAGHNLICENGSLLAESKLFSDGLTVADVDVSRLVHERRRMTTWRSAATFSNYYCIRCFSMPLVETKLERKIYPHPFVPSDKVVLDGRCEEILAIQSVGLATRLKHIGCKTAVVGLSGGLDSTLALIVMRHAFDRLGLDPKGMIAVTMPCFGTTDRTYNNALKLADAYGATLREIDIKKSVRQHFEDIGHDESVHDVTYENGQARERTQILMDIANQCGGIVIGTGDLSELALGWATYNGDHMSMYGVNVSIPKTLVRYLVAYEASHAQGVLHDVLLDILDTPVSPELLPPDQNGEIAQKTEDLVGPYELHDFFLYYHVRLGFTPGKIFRLARIAFADVYDPRTIMKWEKKFYWRFFSQQFKRSCLPDGPKVGSVTLSPRGDWRMPSDASAAVWVKELEEIEMGLPDEETCRKLKQLLDEYNQRLLNQGKGASSGDDPLERLKQLVKENRAISKQRNNNKYEIAYLLYKIKSEEKYKDYKSDSIVPTKCASFESFLNSYRNEIPDNEDCKALAKAGRLIDKVGNCYRSFLAVKRSGTTLKGETFDYWEDYSVYVLAAIAKKNLTREKIKKLHDDGIINPSMNEKEIRNIITNY